MIIKAEENIIVTGEVCKPDRKVLDSGAKLFSFSIKYDSVKEDNGEYKSKFIDVNCWRKLADICNNIRARDIVLVCGKLQKRKWTKKDGTESESYTIVADYVCPASSPGIAETILQENNSINKATPTWKEKLDAMDNSPESGDIPF